MPLNVVKTQKDEAKWKKAEEIAAKAGQEGNYAYVMGIYKKMKPDYKFKKTASFIAKGQGRKAFRKALQIKEIPISQHPDYQQIVGSVGKRVAPRGRYFRMIHPEHGEIGSMTTIPGMGETDAAQRVYLSEVNKKFQGMGMGKKLYGETTRRMPEGALSADPEVVSDSANRVWKSSLKRRPNLTTYEPYSFGLNATMRLPKKALIKTSSYREHVKSLMKTAESNPRIPRKPGQPANSKKHSDLFTDENPKGTIHGLKFVTAKDAAKSVAKIKASGKSHAHKTQAAIAMEQRAKSMGKNEAAAVYRSFIEEQKRKTAEKTASSKILIKDPPPEKVRVQELKLIQQQRSKYKPNKIKDKKLDDIFILYSEFLGIPRSKVKKDCDHLSKIIIKHKNYFDIERPHELAEKIGVSFDHDYNKLPSAHTPSYPSGHSCQGHYLALIYSEQYPNLKNKLMKISKDVSDARIDRGIHFISDIIGGLDLAEKIFNNEMKKTASTKPIGNFIMNEVENSNPYKKKFSKSRPSDIFLRVSNNSLEKTAKIRGKSTPTEDFIGGLDPTGTWTSGYGVANQHAGLSKEEHKRKKRLAQTGGAIGSGLLLPMVTSGVVEAVRGGAKAGGGLKGKLLASAKGFVGGSKRVPKMIIEGSKMRSLGARAAKGKTIKLTPSERKRITALIKESPIKAIIGQRGKGGIGKLKRLRDVYGLARGKLTPSAGRTVKTVASREVAAGLTALGVGGAVGSVGAGIQYDKGRKAYKDIKATTKTANLRGTSNTFQDFLGGIDPTGSYSSQYGLANERAGLSEGQHNRKKRVAQVGGMIGSGIGLPLATTGVVQGIRDAAKAKGGIAQRATAFGKGFVQGAKQIPTMITQGAKTYRLGTRAMNQGGAKATADEIKAIRDVAGSTTIRDLLAKGVNKKSTTPGTMDYLNLLGRGKVTQRMGSKLRGDAASGIAAGVGGMALGGAIGAFGAGAQYDKGRKSYRQVVNDPLTRAKIQGKM